MSLAITVPRPAALAERTDEELATEALAGDERALYEILHRYRPHVRSKARTYFLAGADREDVIQEGMIGLYKAIRDFDNEKQPSFRGFAELCVTRQIISAIKSATRHKHAPLNSYVSLQGKATQDEDCEQHFGDRVATTDPDPIERVISSADLQRLREYCQEVLSDLEVQVLALYVEGRSYSEIAEELGRHVKAVDNAIQRIKKKLDPYLAEARSISLD